MTLFTNFDAGGAGGIADPVGSSQSVFRSVMNAMARPGSIHTIADVRAPSTLMPAAAAVALSLLDHDTPVWVEDGFNAAAEISHWLRFQTGAPPVLDASHAAFALVANGANVPDFASFALGIPEYPDRSTTLVIQIDTLTEGRPLILTGPGIDGTATLRAAALPVDFTERMRANRGLFPRGVDLLFVCGYQIAALPRSTCVTAAEF